MHMSNLLGNISSDCTRITPFTSTATPSTSGEFSDQMEPAACHYSCPGQQSMISVIPGCSHSWRTVLCNHQHNESITTAPFSLRKASVEENQSIQRLRWWLSYVHWTFALNFHESCRLFWLISGKVCIVLFSVKAYDATCFHDLVTFWLTTFMTCKSKSSLFL